MKDNRLLLDEIDKNLCKKIEKKDSQRKIFLKDLLVIEQGRLIGLSNTNVDQNNLLLLNAFCNAQISAIETLKLIIEKIE